MRWEAQFSTKLPHVVTGGLLRAPAKWSICLHTTMFLFLMGTISYHEEGGEIIGLTGTGRISGLVTCILNTRVGYMMTGGITSCVANSKRVVKQYRVELWIDVRAAFGDMTSAPRSLPYHSN